jgi:hypothetical protein
LMCIWRVRVAFLGPMGFPRRRIGLFINLGTLWIVVVVIVGVPWSGGR